MNEKKSGSTDFLQLGNIGVVAKGIQNTTHIAGTASMKVLAFDNSVTPQPTVGDFVVITKIVQNFKARELAKGIFFCNCRALTPEEITPQIFSPTGCVRIYRRKECEFQMSPYAKLVGFHGEGPALKAKMELRYELRYRNSGNTKARGHAMGAFVEGRYFPLALGNRDVDTTKPMYTLSKNEIDETRQYPLLLLNTGTQASTDDEPWDKNFNEVHVQAEKDVMDQAMNLLGLNGS